MRFLLGALALTQARLWKLSVFVTVLAFPFASSALITVGFLDTPGDARDVEVVGGLAYVAAGFSGLRVIDVSNPAAPVELGAFYTPDEARDVEVVDGLAYLANGSSGLRIIDFGPEYRTELEVDLDIKPDGDLNPINPMGRGVIPVGSSARTTSMSRTWTEPPWPLHRMKPRRRMTSVTPMCSRTTSKTSMTTGLVSHYRIRETGIEFGQREACLTGQTLGGIDFRGCDVIRTVRPCGLGFELVLLLPPLLWLRRRRCLTR